MSASDHPMPDTFGSRLASRRKELGLSQTALATRIGASQSSVAEWEADKSRPRTSKKLKLLRVLNISIDKLDPDFNQESGKRYHESISNTTIEEVIVTEEVINDATDMVNYIYLYNNVFAIVQKYETALKHHYIRAEYFGGYEVVGAVAAALASKAIWESALVDTRSDGFAMALRFCLGRFEGAMEGVSRIAIPPFVKDD